VTTKDRELTDQIAIRVDRQLLEELREDAARHGRTVAQSARFHLTRGLRAAS
jgi:plasmid stability protein